MLKYKYGNVFDHEFESNKIYLIPHVCNNIGGFGSGFAGVVAKKYPPVQLAYFELHRESKKPHKIGSFELGIVQRVPVEDNIVFLNMIAQHQTISMNPKPIRYAALVKCMERVSSIADLQKWTKEVEIVCPMFGSGLAKGTWDFIEELILEIWHKHNVTVYDFEGKVVNAENPYLEVESLIKNT